MLENLFLSIHKLSQHIEQTKTFNFRVGIALGLLFGGEKVMLLLLRSLRKGFDLDMFQKITNQFHQAGRLLSAESV